MTFMLLYYIASVSRLIVEISADSCSDLCPNFCGPSDLACTNLEQMCDKTCPGVADDRPFDLNCVLKCHGNANCQSKHQTCIINCFNGCKNQEEDQLGICTQPQTIQTPVGSEVCVSNKFNTCINKGGLGQNYSIPITVNGCGSSSSPLITSMLHQYVPEFTSCCNAHDICYSTCQIFPLDKKKCDDALLSCNQKVCYSSVDPSGQMECNSPTNCKRVAVKSRALCLVQADIVNTGLIVGGCSSYQSAQDDACMCNCQ